MRVINNWFETIHKFICILFAIYKLIFLTFLKVKNAKIAVRSGIAKKKKRRKNKPKWNSQNYEWNGLNRNWVNFCFEFLIFWKSEKIQSSKNSQVPKQIYRPLYMMLRKGKQINVYNFVAMFSFSLSPIAIPSIVPIVMTTITKCN